MPDRNRRQILKSLAGAAAFAGLGTGLSSRLFGQSCSIVTSPALTEGPYFVDEILNRSDITVDPTDNSVQPGTPAIADHQLEATGELRAGALDRRVRGCVALQRGGSIFGPGRAEHGREKIPARLSGHRPQRRGEFPDASTLAGTPAAPFTFTPRSASLTARMRPTSSPRNSSSTNPMTDKIYQAAPYNTRPGRDTLNTIDGIYEARRR